MNYYLVAVTHPDGVGEEDMRRYIEDAVAEMKGCKSPDDPLFDLDGKQVVCTLYKGPVMAQPPTPLTPLAEKIAAERAKTAQHRYYLYTGGQNEAMRHAVMDAEASPKTIAKFRVDYQAMAFLSYVREQYIALGIQG